MSATVEPSPFRTDDADAYQRWREAKLATASTPVEALTVDVRDLSDASPDETARIQAACRRTNWALFRVAQPGAVDEQALKNFGARLGLTRIDRNLCAEDSGVTALTTRPQKGKPYIPYTNRPLNWHTDGYYNDGEHQIRGWILFCAQDAAAGGTNAILDHELVYIHLRDREPALIEALMAPDAMTIPANEEQGSELRPDHSGPVFSVDPGGNLHMRYSARKRNILWKDRPATQAAAEAITTLLSAPDAPIYRYRLRPGEGIVSNNVLHRRDGFEDNPAAGKKRLFYRARYYDRIAGTGINER
jgi:hypothetical protein